MYTYQSQELIIRLTAHSKSAKKEILISHANKRERNTLFTLTQVYIYQSQELIVRLTAHSKSAKKEILISHANNVSIFENLEKQFRR